MKTNQQRSNEAYSAVLAHAGYAGIQSQKTETQIRELLKSMLVLCDEYGVDVGEEFKQFNAGAEFVEISQSFAVTSN